MFFQFASFPSILVIISFLAFSVPVFAQEHPDPIKTVEDSSDASTILEQGSEAAKKAQSKLKIMQSYVSQAQEVIVAAAACAADAARCAIEVASTAAAVAGYSNQAQLIDKVGDCALDPTGCAQEAVNEAVDQASDYAGEYADEYMDDAEGYMDDAKEKMDAAKEKAEEAADYVGDAIDSASSSTSQAVQLGQVTVDADIGDSSIALLNSTLPPKTLAPIVPADVVSDFEEETPSGKTIKEKLTELILIDNTSPQTVKDSQDTQNYLLAMAVMRALDNAKRSFDLSAQAKEELENDQKMISTATTFPNMFRRMVTIAVHTQQKVNEMVALYAQLMELEALNAVSGVARPTDE